MSDQYKKWEDMGERDAYAKALKSVDFISPTQNSKTRRDIAYQQGDQDAYQKAIRHFDDKVVHPAQQSTKSLSQAEIKTAEARGEFDAYAKAMASFRKVSNFQRAQSVIKSIFEMMNSTKAISVKGRFIMDNYKTIITVVYNAQQMGMELTYKDFQDMSTKIFIFLEEYENDLADNYLSDIREKVYKIESLWPNLVEIKGGRNIRFEPNTDLGASPQAQIYSEDGGLISAYVPEVTDLKIEVLSDVMKRYEDTDQLIYADPRTRKLLGYDPIANAQAIVVTLREIFASLVKKNVSQQIMSRALLYESLLALKPQLDNIRTILNPDDPNADVRMPDIKVIQEISKHVAGLMRNKYMPKHLQVYLENIYKALDYSKYVYPRNIGDRISGLGRRLSGDYAKDYAKVLRALKDIEKNYDKIWVVINAGKSPLLRN